MTNEEAEVLKAEALVQHFAYFTAALLKELAEGQPDLCRFDEGESMLILVPGHKIAIKESTREGLRHRVIRARMVPALEPITTDQQPATGRPMTAERLRAIAKRLPDVCYFEELTTTLSDEHLPEAKRNSVSKKKRNVVKELYYLVEDIAQCLETLRYNLLKKVRSEDRGKIKKSVVAEMVLRIGLSQLEDERILNQQIQKLLNLIT